MKNFKLGAKIIRLEQVNSTNQFAKDLSSYVNPIHEGTIIVTYDQPNGKGRHQKTWVSEKNKNLCLSIILFPKFLNASSLFLLSKAISVGIRDYLDSLTILDVKIKWPNDIYVGGRKIAGILIENTWKKNVIQESIIGIGLNVNQTHFPDILRQPTSMKLCRKMEYDLEEVLSGLLESIEVRYGQLSEGDTREIDAYYHDFLFGLNEQLTFNDGKKDFRGSIKGVNNDGKLKIFSQEDGLKEYDLDQIEFRHAIQQDW